MPTLQFELCPEQDAEVLQGFLDQHWRRNHLLARSRSLLDWQHLDPATRRYNFVLARLSPQSEPVGVLGLIPNYQFDPALRACPDLWLAIWKVLPGAGPPGLGVAMLQYAQAQVQPRSVTAIGINQEVARLYRALGYEIFNLAQHYLVNEECATYRILDGWTGPATRPAARPDPEVTVVELDEPGFLAAAATCPHLHDPNVVATKTPEYFRRRFYDHPLYHYHVCAVRRAGRNQAFAAFRRATAAGSAALRLVDWLGPPQALAGLAAPLQQLLQKHEAEYLDLYSWGFPAELLQAAGFLRREPDSAVVVPSYFEPFERRNVEILCAHRALQPGLALRCTRADADQDRPSLLPGECS